MPPMLCFLLLLLHWCLPFTGTSDPQLPFCQPMHKGSVGYTALVGDVLQCISHTPFLQSGLGTLAENWSMGCFGTGRLDIFIYMTAQVWLKTRTH